MTSGILKEKPRTEIPKRPTIVERLIPEKCAHVLTGSYF